MLDRPSDPAQRRRARKAAQAKRRRRRQGAGLIWFSGEIDAAGLEWLVVHGYVDAAAVERAGDDSGKLGALVGPAVTALIKVSSRL